MRCAAEISLAKIGDDQNDDRENRKTLEPDERPHRGPRLPSRQRQHCGRRNQRDSEPMIAHARSRLDRGTRSRRPQHPPLPPAPTRGRSRTAPNRRRSPREPRDRSRERVAPTPRYGSTRRAGEAVSDEQHAHGGQQEYKRHGAAGVRGGEDPLKDIARVGDMIAIDSATASTKRSCRRKPGPEVLIHPPI